MTTNGEKFNMHSKLAIVSLVYAVGLRDTQPSRHNRRESRAITKMTARCALCMDAHALKNFANPGYVHGYFPELLIGLKCVQNLKFVLYFTRSWDIRGYLKTLGSP